ncbi:acyltransferase family protein [Porticoccus sp.]
MSDPSPFSLRRNLRLLLKPEAGQLRPIDGLRALSILLVLAIHSVWFLSIFDTTAPNFFYGSPVWLNWVFNGELGVDVFFVISGFLISSILMSEYRDSGGIRFGRFYQRRFMRLMPAYLLAMGLGLLALPNKEYIWSNLLYINNLLPASTHFMPWTWSLAIEEQFYFLFPLLLLWVLRKRSPLFLAGLALAAFAGSLLIRYLLIQHYQLSLPICWYEKSCDGFFAVIDSIYVKPWARFGSFLPGIFAAYFHVFHRERLRETFRCYRGAVGLLTLLSVLTVLLVLSVPVNNQHASFSGFWSTLYYTGYRNLFTAAVGVILLASLYGDYGFSGWLARLLSSPVLYPIGQLAYSTYLFHPFVIGGVYTGIFQSAVELSSIQKIAMAAAIGIPMSLLVAALVYLAVERPVMNLRGRQRQVAEVLVEG